MPKIVHKRADRVYLTPKLYCCTWIQFHDVGSVHITSVSKAKTPDVVYMKLAPLLKNKTFSSKASYKNYVAAILRSMN